MSTPLQRIKVACLTTDQGNYNVLGMYDGFGHFDCHNVAKVLHTAMRILPKKVLSVTYPPNNDPFENMSNPDSSHYIFIDFHWIDQNSNIERLLRRQKYYCIHRSPSEVWLLKLQDFETNLLRHSHTSTIMYFTNIKPEEQHDDYDCIFEEKRFDGNEEDPPMGYRDAYISVMENTFF